MHPLDAILDGWRRQATEPLFSRTRAVGKAFEDLCIAFLSHDPVRKESGSTNDPNAWFPDEAAFISAVHRIVHLSVETVRIVASLPGAFAESQNQPGGECG